MENEKFLFLSSYLCLACSLAEHWYILLLMLICVLLMRIIFKTDFGQKGLNVKSNSFSEKLPAWGAMKKSPNVQKPT